MALDEVITEYAAVARLPTSAGERQVAHALATRLTDLGCAATVEEEPAHSSYAVPIGALSALGVAAGFAAGRGARLAGTVGGTLAAAAIADDVAGGDRLFRRVFVPRRTAYNVVARCGDPDAARTVVVLAHHDAAPGGAVFDQRFTRWLAARYPDVLARAKTNPPLWWPVIAGPALVAAGSALGSRRLRRTGMVLSLLTCAAMADIGRRPAVPGANDNLSGVAAMLAVAEALQRSPVDGLRVLFVSAGAEEALQEGIRGFARRHFPSLPRDRTWFVNLESVGSGRLALLEGEGPVRMRDYDAAFKDLTAACAEDEGIPLTRGLRSRSSTDSEVPRRHGYPVATIVSLDEHRLIPHYHLATDLPEHVDLRCVAEAARLAEAVIRRLNV
jgi:acetylornithine deacetylase/succinyl-diaminopimelate desuccinylase-like protein